MLFHMSSIYDFILNCKQNSSKCMDKWNNEVFDLVSGGITFTIVLCYNHSH